MRLHERGGRLGPRALGLGVAVGVAVDAQIGVDQRARQLDERLGVGMRGGERGAAGGRRRCTAVGSGANNPE
jgi:hypothetical protein